MTSKKISHAAYERGFIAIANAQSQKCTDLLNLMSCHRHPDIISQLVEAVAVLRGMAIMIELYCDDPSVAQHFFQGCDTITRMIGTAALPNHT